MFHSELDLYGIQETEAESAASRLFEIEMRISFQYADEPRQAVFEVRHLAHLEKLPIPFELPVFEFHAVIPEMQHEQLAKHPRGEISGKILVVTGDASIMGIKDEI